MYIYTVCYLYVICMLSVSIWATVNISLYSSKSSNFKGCTIVFQGLGNHVRIPCIFHSILMVFRQGMKHFLAVSNAAQSSEF